MSDMRTIVPRRKDRIIHVETELGIVDVYLRLHDASGRRVERVEIIPNGYAGEPCVTLEGGSSRLIEQTPAT
jgi:hypothetical protein